MAGQIEFFVFFVHFVDKKEFRGQFPAGPTGCVGG
jgi:hypothetical protein